MNFYHLELITTKILFLFNIIFLLYDAFLRHILTGKAAEWTKDQTVGERWNEERSVERKKDWKVRMKKENRKEEP